MLKRRHGSSVVVGLKRHRSSVVGLLLPHDAVELILERLPVESLLKFKSVSKNWKSTIESRCFKERQLIRRKQSRGPDVLLVPLTWSCDGIYAESIALGSSIVSTVRLPTSSGSRICHGSCDGLLCLYCVYTPSVVVNPATGWHQTFPLSNLQLLCLDMYDKPEDHDFFPMPNLGFGRDKFTGTYKPVWLYNSSDFGLPNATTCEVFDFSTNTWRYVHPSPPHRIDDFINPVYLDGSLHWLAEGEEETKVLSFDLHSETFHVLCKAPFARDHFPFSHNMFILDNRLCVSEQDSSTQVIWSFHSSGGNKNKTWNKLCSIDVTRTRSWFIDINFPLAPIAILDKNKLLLQGRHCVGDLVIHDLHAKSYDLLLKPETRGYPVYYFQSLFSALSN
ncbi:unnamed protein product [Arabidopsis lyrata]|uniref:F-box protein At1g11270 n=1 Tax=Arabidopsis lyrata subsp. lyrata TaxID=81972 RepID=UPI000A29E145|nr:F-box protein At1g11270 [Arabidopsis lyrata subsp. lyrata]XP_020882024.1 F-box protein At1g11270 [Arabidopsis lyrata subsp. lyrata]XP_020882025.1 F-box protein At1g11270 [Arabidopsis lyrata subsp. lyrata]XP_020882026.1 F-box protein At1g11270 [Arabidopsis lyrata subsp. lyrata]CAH8266937.1 unnamed protein product [Arabidopsis lyrata]|eukprot:XP_020882023.1 F-box protein At1g11270 [Arabidopsis lyrata subsp. lyrata]